MTWEWVTFALGLAMIFCGTILGWKYLNFIIASSKKKDEEYKQLKALLESKAERDEK